MVEAAAWGKDPKDQLVVIDPEIIFSEGKLYEEEGCLSFPDIREKVVRAAKVRIRAQDVQRQVVREGRRRVARARHAA